MRGAWVAGLSSLMLLVLSGCAENPYALQGKNKTLQQQQLAMQQEKQQLQGRAETLDHDNQELESMLARERQQSKLLEDRLTAMQDQLSGASSQLAQLRTEKDATQKQAETMMASARRRAGATITANSSLTRTLPRITLPGIEVRQDGDVIRVELPAAQFFQPGTATLQQTTNTTLDMVATELARSYPDQLIAVEGHTDADSSGAAGWATNQQISTARSLAIYQYLATRGPLRPQQLFTVGHGGNHPLVSNATPGGRQRNQRVELVIYPDRVGQ